MSLVLGNRVRRASLLSLGFGGWLALAGAAHAQSAAQTESGDTASTASADSLQLVFEREVFTYPEYQRRNPFAPLTGDEVSGPRFEDVVLVGVVVKPDPRESVAVIGARPPGSTSDQVPTRTYRLRAGESLGNMRVIDIDQGEALIEVADFGVAETRRLPLWRPPARPIPPPFSGRTMPRDSTEVAPPPAPAPTDSVVAVAGDRV